MKICFPASGAFSLLLVVLTGAAGAAEYDCLIEARQQVDIRSPVEAVIESVLVQRGDLVKKGQYGSGGVRD